MEKRKDLSSGVPELDRVLEGIWAGDNIVLQTDRLEDFLPFAQRYCAYTQEAGRKLIYFRFADHPSLLPEGVPAEVHELDPRGGFEQFIARILTIIDRNGHDSVYYLFDCLSGLATDWYSDRMLGNFFRLTCPYLYDYDTVALFVLLRDVPTPLASRVIHDTAQVVLDVFRNDDRLYVLPLKVFDRHSPTMYMLHSWDEDGVNPVTQSTVLSEILSATPQPWIDPSADLPGPWTRTFMRAQSVQARIAAGEDPGEDVRALTDRLIRMLLSRDENEDLFRLCSEYFELEDLIAIGKRMVGTGLVGGKSVGMLLARKILARNAPEIAERLEIHDSFYVGSDVFYSYLVLNDCWWERHHLRGAEHFYEQAEHLREKLNTGSFPASTIAQFREILEYFGQSPVIVRSSSLLEDAYGNSFSGKYESVFCANQGDPEQRLANFMEAVRTIYASTMSVEALSYRRHRGLLHRDEQMALLVQRVSGEFQGDLYFPHIGGVGYSFNPYVWSKKIDPADGMLRLVFGLGTRAVDRHDDDYTRVVALNAPMLRPDGSSDEVRKYSQHIVNVIDLEENAHVSRRFEDVARVSDLPIDMFASRDTDMETRAREAGIKDVFSSVLTFKKLLTATPFAEVMRDMMQTVAQAYQHPVDIEFTVNFLDEQDYRINLLQCRPFHFAERLIHVQSPGRIPVKDILLQTNGPLIGQSLATEVDRIVYVVPERYGALPTRDRHEVARLIGKITNHPDRLQTTVLVGPGRWGTSMPELGIPVTLSQIKNVTMLCEIARMHEGLTPDLSLGTHFFNDLVDLEIGYMGVSPERPGSILNTELIEQCPNRLGQMLPEFADRSDLINVIDAADLGGRWIFLWADMLKQQGAIYLSDVCAVGQDTD
ncbi:MAG: PEP/pyruvate-binding domain-containing protein [Anaerosomatales bacterium]